MSKSEESLYNKDFNEFPMKKNDRMLIIVWSLISSFLFGFLLSYLYIRDVIFNTIIGLVGIIFAIGILSSLNILELD